MAGLSHQAQNSVGIINGGRHEIRCFVTSIPKHDALITGTLCLLGCFIHTHGDIRRLFVQIILHHQIFPMKAPLFISNTAHGLTHHVLDDIRGHVIWSAHFPHQNHTVGGGRRFNGAAGVGIAGQIRIHQSIGNLIANFIGVTFGNRFTCKQKSTHDDNPKPRESKVRCILRAGYPEQKWP